MQAKTAVADALTDDDTGRPPSAAAPIPGLVWAFRIHADGRPESLAIDQPIALVHDGLLWLHFNLADARALQWLASADLRTRSRRGRFCCRKILTSSFIPPTTASTA